jgi:glutamate-1-semialdehyde 2,1-aminomutase
MNLKNGLDLWKKAKKYIPGGSQLLSKRSEMFLPDQWPSYYKKAKGVEIWDLDGNKFIDMTLMGIGACTLGYADDDVNKAVKKVVDDGSMATLNSPEEIELAELLFKLHPWAGSVRYARTGGESMAVAVRIARAHSKKDKIAFCGYHGWHDWYLASNLGDNSALDGHLIKGLDPNGTPRHLQKTAFPFEYNNIDQLKEIVKNEDIGVIVIETVRHQEPTDNFLGEVRKIADKIGAVLVFDEITAGWRLIIGGAHLLYDVTPDIAVFAKAISNGYPMAAIIGKKDVMDAAQTSFISSTYWTERIGPAAAIATINKMIKVKLPEYVEKIGALIRQGWEELAKKHSLDLSFLIPNALVTFSFNYENALELTTLFTQEMLERGYLATTSVYVCYAHTEDIVKEYLKKVDEVFGIIAEAIKQNNVVGLLKGPVKHSGFQRLT